MAAAMTMMMWLRAEEEKEEEEGGGLRRRAPPERARDSLNFRVFKGKFIILLFYTFNKKIKKCVRKKHC
jgi:hypothetical protein